MNMPLQVCDEMGVEVEARAVVLEMARPHAAVHALLERGKVQAALQVLSRLLPQRYVVAWLCQCVREGPMMEGDLAGLALAECWVREPEEEQRRAAYEFAVADGYRTLGGWLAAAAGWAGGSLAPASQETPVPPPPYLTARAAVAIVNILAAREPKCFDERRASFVKSAVVLLDDGGMPP